MSLDDAVLRGLAPDGGLYLPTRLPPLPPDWREAGGLADLAVRVLAPWWGEAADEVAPLLRDALDFDTPVRSLSDGRWLLELFHGPTLSFKDVGARVMARLAGRALARRGGRATVLVATSGDTGSAVADGFAGVPGVRVALLYPRGRVSEVQERQLVAARPGVRTFAVEGDFDACQRLVKGAFADPALRPLGLTSANSINVGRLLPQMLYYLWGALQLRRDAGVAEPYVVVPSGNLGNLTGGLLAAEAGLPVAGFLAAHNANDFLPAYLAGRRDAGDMPATVATWSNAMDVGAPSNFERLHRWLGAGLAGRVAAVSVDDDAALARMRRTLDQEGLHVCPHTAVGLEALARRRAQGAPPAAGPALVLATAHPAKFPDAARAATGREPAVPPALAALADAPRRVEPLRAHPAALRDALLLGSWPDD
jgi:threonine synthase